MSHRPKPKQALPSPKQALLLWRLITAETEEERVPLQSKTNPRLSVEERTQLVDDEFIRLEKKPGKGGLHIVLTDKAWVWAQTTLDVELMQSHSRVGAQALQGLLRKLLPFLQQNDLPLASLFASGQPLGTGANVEPRERADSPWSDREKLVDASVPRQIEAACLSLAGGERKARVRLSELRRHLGTIARDVLDRALLELQDQRRLVLYRDDNMAALTDDDRDAALYVGDAPRHLVYLEAR